MTDMAESESDVSTDVSALPMLSHSVSYTSIQKPPFVVSVIGSGNWGTTVAKIIAENTRENPLLFEQKVRMWVYEEEFEGSNLSDIINTEHVNKKYLPGIKLPDNLVAVPDLLEAVQYSNILIFNIPHQHLEKILSQLRGNIDPRARAISCLKGLRVNLDGVELLPDIIQDALGIHCGVLAGANLAQEVAEQRFSETTVGYPLPADYKPGDVDHTVLYTLFHRPYFHVHVIEDIAGISCAGALKNIIAISVGFVEGLEWGDNAKAAMLRRGLLEMIKFGRKFFPGCLVSSFTEESAGVADLFTTCTGGRNFKLAKIMAQTGKSAHEVEKEILNGQSAQGLITAKEIHELIKNKGCEEEFPLFETTYQILFHGVRIGILPYMLENKWSISKPNYSS
ncbi:glycerol-3-phosphate dehydrogenase family protein [Cyberlindnera jadinii NRRL Y-1542]|uniref:Glycerol-3-phosphate dehydrogenase [NAD(+)] n=1 Tax=Cyberlindnera jadinii (strain ATCC 18201 / CBS 1600 / BCRC 20928 / JCM 3617 / NBRC 0987 / NRRL Y-1542) TaxID=983966 RepID=A0A1E4S0R2_CYBJN|nr:glycerol-3-phosphate dehydrogenase [NAD+] 2 [Cyberlindnera jadinii NRRL Y-1542]ODV73087.1 glycerol-3-phosphate dehydrogenase [NAD+] 2 [Cyberlindnera jadinii NRRL Y-1542]